VRSRRPAKRGLHGTHGGDSGVDLTAQLHELTLNSLTYGGEVAGRLSDGRIAFVGFGLPGERVLIELLEEKGHFARGRIVRVLEPSRDRIPARCKHYGVCGGCHYQHMPYQEQLRAKSQILEDQLTRIGHFESPTVRPTVGSPSSWNYRNQVQFHLTETGRVGYVMSRDTPQGSRRILGIEECHLPEAPIAAFWPQLAFDAHTDLGRVDIRLGSNDEILVVLESESESIAEMEIEAEVSVVHLSRSDVVVLAGNEHVMMRVKGRTFRVAPTSFFQVNTPVAEMMVEHMLSQLPGRLGAVIDVYCGVGLFSAFLAERSERVIGIEASTAACEDFAYNLDDFDNVELYEDTAERVLPALNVQAEAAIVDPPRAGLKRVVLDQLIRMGPPRVIYVSCNPSTLARDAQLLSAQGYQLQQAKPFDVFPQTYHIESISLFSR
jgi:23S rRNA (uracil1939-C5)-methyltransferase